ncbi:MAG TPA: beta-propeller domain-containing protein, partial [Xanthomonadales bacterium]|nr:beta-propeller domain-containing protein [Xanthomonadales bacterium]
AAAPALADVPLLAERSPVRTGLWYDPQRAGSGFDVHVGTDQIFVVWYTYRADGSATWYTAQGPMDAQGRFDAALLEHRWRDGRYGGFAEVGRMVLQRTHPEALDLRWTLDGASGDWDIVPFPISGVGSEIDHTGAYYDRERTGYGLTITEQGDWLASAYYAYDAAGRPTWLFGTNAGRGSTLSLGRFSGACPSCPQRSATSLDDVQMQLTLESETRLSFSLQDAESVLAPEWRRFAQPLNLLTTPASQRPADRQLAAFVDPAALDGYIRSALMNPAYYQPVGVIDFSPPPANSYSTTNLVESGVDEPDVVKTDGRYVYTFDATEDGRRIPFVRVARVRDDGPDVDIVGRFATAVATQTDTGNLAQHRLFVDGNHLVTLSTTVPYAYGVFEFSGFSSWQGGRTFVEIFDRSNPTAPVSRFNARFDGHLIAARRIGDQLLLVGRSAPAVDGYRYGSSAETLAYNAQLVAATPFAELVPSVRVGGSPAADVPLVDASNVLLPPGGSRVASPEYLTVTRISLANPADRESFAVVGGVESVYASPTSLYVATTRYEPTRESTGFFWPGFASTDVHQFALRDGRLDVVATGSVEGVVGRDTERAPFRFSEHEGRLRLVTVGSFGQYGSNRLTVLEPSQRAPGRLRTVSVLPNIDRPEPIGKPHEQLYGTRFVGDRLYAVTFLNIDPLYVVDLSNAADPRIAGALELPGYSDYLHPLPNGLLLGIGKDASPASGIGDGRFAFYQGMKITLFDVADPNAPRLLDSRLIGQRGSGSAILSDHHALSTLQIDATTTRFALPIRVHGNPAPSQPDFGSRFYDFTHSGLYALDVTGTGANARLVAHAPLVTTTSTFSYDDATTQARSVLFPTGAVYVERGRYWAARWGALGTPTAPK